MGDDVGEARPSRPLGNSCSRCGKQLPADAAGWQWLGDEGLELVCPDCTRQREADQYGGSQAGGA
jgi:DNA-directed RNA polymerase subunit RPC12/RpoP